MEDNKIATLDTNTSDVSNNEVNDGKTFSQTDVNNLTAKVRGEEKAKYEKLLNEAVANAVAEYDRQAKLTAEEREKEAKKNRNLKKKLNFQK